MNARLWRHVVAAYMALASSGCGAPNSTAPVRQDAAQQAPSRPAIEPRHQPAPAGYDLAADEALGGHTLHRHVGKSDADLIERLEREPHISSASTYTDRSAAESVVSAALQTDNRAFAAWRSRRGPRPNFVLRYRADRVIGRSIARGHWEPVPCDRALVVLRWDERRQRAYVLTSYPEANR